MKQVLLTSVTFDTDGDTAIAASLAAEWAGTLFELKDFEGEAHTTAVANYLSDETGWLVEDLSLQYIA